MRVELLWLAASTLLSPFVSASSTSRNPLTALSAVQNATIHTPNHRITALSDFDLSFNLRNDLQVKLRLEPNHDILGADTTVTFLAEDGSVQRRESVDRLKHKVYRGSAWVQRARTGDDWRQVGWARVTVSRDGPNPIFNGAFVINRDSHHIQTATNYRRTKHRQDPEIEESHGGDEYMVVWRDSDVMKDVEDEGHQDLRRGLDAGLATCQADTLNFNSQPDHPVFVGMRKRSEQSYGFMDFSNIFKRQIDTTTGGNGASGNLVSSIGSTVGCPTTRKVALMGIATDCNYLDSFDGNQTAARENILDLVNSASAVYERTFSISLGLQDLTILPENCPGTPAEATQWNQVCSDSVDISTRLNLFSAWRGSQTDTNAFWTLLSTCGTGSAVGLAWLGQVCVGTSFSTNETLTGDGSTGGGSGTETVSGANVVIRTNGVNEWQVLAHEVGHTFGAVHDCTASSCANTNFVQSQQCCQYSASECDAGARFIMNPSTGDGVEDFSPCSIGNICSGLARNSVDGACLVENRGVTTITGQQCGNGIVEPGEDCDCGGADSCAGDKCCNAETCQFTEGSVCDDANEDCCNQCQFALSGTVCRASTGECDPQEVCTGNSASCPTDETEEDGTDCGDGDLRCASGQCTSRDNECKVRMGSYTRGNDTYACGNSGCIVSCASPEFGYNTCYSLQQNFLDGIPCGGGGSCQNGQCRGSTFGGEVRSWIDEHRNIVIGVGSAVGGLLLIAVISCIISCCRKRRTKRRQVPNTSNVPPGGWQGWNSGNAPRPPMSQHPSQGWANHGGQGSHYTPPPMPPPSYSQRARYA